MRLYKRGARGGARWRVRWRVRTGGEQRPSAEGLHPRVRPGRRRADGQLQVQGAARTRGEEQEGI